MESSIDLSGYRFAALIFDCDGTLAATAPVHYLALSNAFLASGMEMRRSWYYERLGLSRDALFAEFIAENGVSFDVEATAKYYQEIYHTNIHKIKEVRLVAQTARTYSGRVPISVASGGQRVAVEATLQAIGLRSLFEHVVTVEDVTMGKPSPQLFLLAASRMNVAPEDCLVFEDSPEGLEAAHAAGMAAIDVRPLLEGA